MVDKNHQAINLSTYSGINLGFFRKIPDKFYPKLIKSRAYMSRKIDFFYKINSKLLKIEIFSCLFS